jgi:signal transduction histidine kinase
LQSNGQEKNKKVTQTDHTLSRLASIGQIAAGIAHEVRNPLTAVKGFLQLLQEEFSHRYLDIACSELDQAISTLQDLLQVSKPDLEDESYIAINLCSELESLLYLFQDQIYRVQIVRNFRNSDEIIYGKMLSKPFRMKGSLQSNITAWVTSFMSSFLTQGSVCLKKSFNC